MRGFLRTAVLLFALMLGACGTSRVPGYEGGDISCVPYARERSGISLQGDAWQWWGEAAGRYERSRTPRPGSVMVVGRTSRMRQGHVAVVSRVVSAREIRVDHANWASGRARGQIARDQPVLDVSPAGDWSQVRIWYPPIRSYGRTTYPVYGFVHARPQVAAR